MGRFNIQGERKLYLADHPYIALKECRIEPGQYFLFSYFRFNDDTYFIDATNSETKFSNTLKSLFQSEDKRFYEVINKIYKDYLDYPEFQGIAYNSARVPEKHQHEAWGEIDSITNLAMKEDHIPSADLLVGWLAQCDKNYYPRYFRMFTPNPKKKKLTTTNYHGNKAKFISSYEKTIENIQNIRRKSTLRIKNKEYIDPQINPVKISNKN